MYLRYTKPPTLCVSLSFSLWSFNKFLLYIFRGHIRTEPNLLSTSVILLPAAGRPDQGTGHSIQFVGCNSVALWAPPGCKGSNIVEQTKASQTLYAGTCPSVEDTQQHQETCGSGWLWEIDQTGRKALGWREKDFWPSFRKTEAEAWVGGFPPQTSWVLFLWWPAAVWS